MATTSAAGVGLLAMRFSSEAAEADDEMVLIPAGSFLMGTTREQAEQLAQKYQCHVSWFEGEWPQRKIELPAFKLDKFPVTNRRYAAFVKATGHTPPFHWPGKSPADALLDHPVCNISRADARAFAKWEGKSLPTAAQWEKAARGTDGRLFPWGNDFDPKACHHDHGGVTPPSGTSPVGMFSRGDSPYGAKDMAGNVAEYCEDQPGINAAYIKGGCWLTASPLNLRCAALGLSGNDRNALDYIGFRCAKEI